MDVSVLVIVTVAIVVLVTLARVVMGILHLVIKHQLVEILEVVEVVEVAEVVDARLAIVQVAMGVVIRGIIPAAVVTLAKVVM